MSETVVTRAGKPVLGDQAVVFLVGDFQRHLRAAGFDLGDAARRIGDELDRHVVEGRLAAPVVRVGLEAHEGVLLELVDHVGAGADRRLLEAFGADLLVIGLRQDVAGEERHPLEQRRVELDDVAGDLVAVDLEVADVLPDELDRVAGLFLAGALQRPDHVLGGERRAVMPGDAFAHRHHHLLVVVAPAPFGEQARREGQVGLLRDELVEHRLVDALDGRVDRRGPGRRVPGRQVDVVGDGQLACLRRGDLRHAERRHAERRGAVAQKFASVECHFRFPFSLVVVLA